MKTKNILITAFSLVIAGVIFSLTASQILAYQGDYTKKGPNCTDEQHALIEKAFEKNDYEAWKKLMQGKGRVTQVINKDNFAKFAKAYRLAEQGKYTEADSIRKELGLRTSNGQKTGNGYGQGRNR